MKYEAYIKLEQALKNNELDSYLLAKPGYRLSSYHDPNFPVMNDYKSLVVALNDYGKNHLGFDLKVTHSMINCLNLCTPGATYNIMQIIREQLILEEYNENSIKFINKEVYEKLRIAILKNNEFFNNYKEYEGKLYENGMNGALKQWSDEIYEKTGYKVIWTEEELKKEEENE